MKAKKTVFYCDPVNDDFAATSGKIRKKQVDENYRYRRSGLLYRIFEFLLYRGIATPLVFLYTKLAFGLRIQNRKAIRKLKNGYFLYGNHTQNVADAFIPTLISFPKKCHIITSSDTVSIPIIRALTPMLGAIPLPGTIKGVAHFHAALDDAAQKRRAVTVYPEAHIWPFCNFIRPFRDDAFSYPVRFGLPAVPFTVTYRERKIFRFLYPLITVTIGEPVYPDTSLGVREARKKLRDEIYADMNRVASMPGNVEYIAYRRQEEAEREKVPSP